MNEQALPSVAIGPYPSGYYSVFYVSVGDSGSSYDMVAKRNAWTNLNNAWTTLPTYTETCSDPDYWYSSACVGTGNIPNYGGACNGEANGNPTTTVFAWAGALVDGETTPGGEVSFSANPDELVPYSLESKPNPFNPSTVVRYTMPEARHVSLKVFDVSGRMIANLVDEWREAGTHEVSFDGSRLSTGLYFVTMQAGEFSEVRKMMLVK
jgi:hypothetical protein